MDRPQLAFPLAEPRSTTILRPSERDPLTRQDQAGTTDAATWIRRTTTVAVVLVALVAAVASYEHMRALAGRAGEGWRSWLLPISVDGLAVAASMTMLVRRRAGQAAGMLPWVALLLGLGASLAANVAAADPTVVEIGRAHV